MTVNDIKAAALSLFAGNSYEGASLAEIAKRAEIKKPSIYAHFRSKEDLYLSVFNDVMRNYVDHIRQQMGEAATGSSAENKLYIMFSGTCRFYQDNEEKAAFLKRAMMFPPAFLEGKLRDAFSAYEKETTEMLQAIFNEGIETGTIRCEKVEDLIAAFYCQIDGLFMQMLYCGRDNFDSKQESVWSIFWSGINNH